MKTRFLLLGSLFLLNACVTFQPGSVCEGSVGSTVSVLFYGDSQIRITPITKVKANSVLRIRLNPIGAPTDPVNYETVTVEISPKPPTTGTWLAGSGSYDSTTANSHELRFCVPADPVGTMYWFNVDITPDIGKLDPRAEVVN